MSQKKSFRINIKQNVPPGQRSHDPVDRTVKPDEVVVVRSKGEGTKPLFARDNIVVNQEFDDSDDSNDDKYKRTKYVEERQRRHSKGRKSYSRSPSTDHKYKSSAKHRRRSKSHSRTKDKSPYYIDEQREKDRLARKYGRKSKSKSPDERRDYRKSSRSERDRSSYRRRSKSLVKKKSPEDDSYYVDAQREKDRLREERKRYERLLKEMRSKSRYRDISRSPERYTYRSGRYHRYRSRTRSRSRSRCRRSRSYDPEWRHRYERSRERPPYTVEHHYPMGHGYAHYRDDLYYQSVPPIILPPHPMPRLSAAPAARYLPAHSSNYGHGGIRPSYYPPPPRSYPVHQPSRYPYRPL